MSAKMKVQPPPPSIHGPLVPLAAGLDERLQLLDRGVRRLNVLHGDVRLTVVAGVVGRALARPQDQAVPGRGGGGVAGAGLTLPSFVPDDKRDLNSQL